MSWNAQELDVLLSRDFDDVVGRARALEGKARTAALRDALARLQSGGDELDRLKILLFVQALLASAGDGKLAASVAEPAASELSRVVMSPSESYELKRPALDSLALLFLKAKELSVIGDAYVRTAFEAAAKFHDPQLREFAQRAFLPNGVLAQRVVQRQYRYVNVSIKTGAAIGITGAVLAVRAARKNSAAKQRGRTESVPRTHSRNSA